MARIRTIKPQFFTSEDIVPLKWEQRLTFIGLWTHVDDEGRCVDNARLIKAAIWPLDDDRLIADVEIDLGVLAEHALITRYMAGGRRYLVVNGFRRHQVINRPTKSTLPAPEEGIEVPLSSGFAPSATDVQGLLVDDSVSTPIRKGRERKGKEVNTRAKRQRGKYTPEFEQLWSVYPRKLAKDAAARAYENALSHATSDEIEDGARAYRDDPDRQRADIKFTAHLATWLNAGRWKDEAPQPVGDDQRPFWDN